MAPMVGHTDEMIRRSTKPWPKADASPRVTVSSSLPALHQASPANFNMIRVRRIGAPLVDSRLAASTAALS